MNPQDPRTQVLAVTSRQPLDAVAAWPDTPTTRRSPRTLTEAFDGPERAQAVYGPYRDDDAPLTLRMLLAAVAVVATVGAASVALALVWGFAMADQLRAALERIASFSLSQFMGPHDMALECVNVARAALAAPTEPVTGEYVPEICTDRPDVICWYRLGHGPKVPSDDSIVRILKRDGSEWLLKVRDVPWDDVAGWKPFGLGMLDVGVSHG